METRLFGRAPVPVVGQGTWMMERDDRASVLAALRRGVDLGLVHVDTAEMYGSGAVEEILGEALQGIRDRVFLVSKVLPSNASYDGTVRACERSLARLRTDRLDSYLLHWPGSHPLAETLRAFETLRRDGKIRSWGVSNFDVAGMEEVLALSKDCACNQVLYHAGERAIEHDVLPWCAARGVAVVAYSPLAQGRFPSNPRALGEVAKARGATARQVALAFLLRNPGVLVIPKAGRVAHVEENAGAAALRLTADEASRIDADFPKGRPRGLPML
jgi:diketogulonate reductase-like aldo/keto reductase